MPISAEAKEEPYCGLTRMRRAAYRTLPSSSASSVPLCFRFCCCSVSSQRLRASAVLFFSPVNQRPHSGVAQAAAVLLLLAVAIFFAGAVRYYRHGSFTLAQAGYCLVAIVVSLVVLMVFDYTLHHARIVAVMVLVFVVLFMVASPAFCVGMGLGLAGMVLAQGRAK